MPFCPACSSEFRAGFTRCEECDAALVDQLPAAPPRPAPPPNPAILPVYRTPEIVDALAIRSLLVGQGFEANLENENSAFLVMGLPTAALPFVVSVPATDAADASAIIKEALDTRPRPIRSDRFQRRLWMATLPFLVLADWGMLAGLEGLATFLPPAAMGLLVLALIFDIRTRVNDPVFFEGRILTFLLLGASVSTGIALALEAVLPGILDFEPATAKFYFLIVGPVEEAAKFLPVFVLAAIRPSWFRDPIAWVVAGASTGGGFGLAETFLKLGGIAHDPLKVVVSAGSSGLLHPLLSGMVGYFISKSGTGIVPVGIAGLTFAALLHGGWNSLMVQDLDWICLLALALAVWFYLRNVGRLFPEGPGYVPSSSSAPAT